MTRNHESQAGLRVPAASRVGVALLALIGFSATVRADVVTDWNTIAVSTVSADTLSNRQNRAMAMVHAAMFDAMNAIRPYYTPAMVLIMAKGYASREAGRGPSDSRRAPRAVPGPASRSRREACRVTGADPT
jgi:hypothetical protein